MPPDVAAPRDEGAEMWERAKQANQPTVGCGCTICQPVIEAPNHYGMSFMLQAAQNDVNALYRAMIDGPAHEHGPEGRWSKAWTWISRKIKSLRA